MQSVTSNAVAEVCTRFVDYSRNYITEIAKTYTLTKDSYVEWLYLSVNQKNFYVNGVNVAVIDYFASGNYVNYFSGYLKAGTVISSSDNWTSANMKVYALRD